MIKRYNKLKEGFFNKTPKDITVYDNGGKSIDRYTVIIGDEAYGMNEYPDRPDGYNQYIGTVGRDLKLGSHLGRIVRITKLPDRVVRAIEDRLEEENYY